MTDFLVRIINTLGRKTVVAVCASALMFVLGIMGDGTEAMSNITTLFGIFVGGNASEWWAKRPSASSPPATAVAPPPLTTVAGGDSA